MLLPRREFLNLMGAAAGAVGLGGCTGAWAVPDRRIELALRGPGLETWSETVCGLCPGGCGMTVRLIDGLPVGVRGNTKHPLNTGGLCPVGQSALDILYSPSRLEGPLRRNSEGQLEAVSWEAVLDEISNRLVALRDSQRSHRIALVCGSSDRLLQELSAHFMNALGSPNIAFTQSPQLPSHLSQGTAEAPALDLENCDLVLSFGWDLFEDGPAPLRVMSALIGSRTNEDRASTLFVGSRLSPSASKAERFVTIQPGTHAAFALGVAHVLIREGLFDREFVAQHTLGFEDWQEGGALRPGFRRFVVENYYPDRVAAICGCDSEAVFRIARRLGRARTPLAVSGGEAATGSNATWTGLAVHALNALLGSLNRPGGVLRAPSLPLSPLPETGLGRDSATASFFSKPAAGALGRDPFQALLEHQAGSSEPIEVLFLVGSDPLYESVLAAELGETFQGIPLVVKLDGFRDDTANRSTHLLPTPVFLESWLSQTTPAGVSISVLGVGQPLLEPLYDVRQPGDILLELGRRSVGDAERLLPWDDYPAYLKERVSTLALSGQGAILSGSFEENWKHFLEERGWRFSQVEGAEDFWKELVRRAGWSSQVPLVTDWSRFFGTPSGRFEFFSQALYRHLLELGHGEGVSDDSGAIARAAQTLGLNLTTLEVCLPHHEPPLLKGEGELELVLFRPITARGSSAPASRTVSEMFGFRVLSGWNTWAEISPESAHELDVRDGDHLALETPRGTIRVVAHLHPGIAPGSIQVPIGLGHAASFTGAEIGSNPISLLEPVADPLSGALALGSSKVRVRLLQRRPHGEPVEMHEGGIA